MSRFDSFSTGVSLSIPKIAPCTRALGNTLLLLTSFLNTWCLHFRGFLGISPSLASLPALDQTPLARNTNPFSSGTDDILVYCLPTQVFRNIIVCTTSLAFRMGYYGWWGLTDTAVLLTGVVPGANVKPFEIETALSPAKFWTLWNISMQSWLRKYIFQKLPSSCRGLIGVLITFLVCGAWVSQMNSTQRDRSRC